MDTSARHYADNMDEPMDNGDEPADNGDGGSTSTVIGGVDSGSVIVTESAGH